MNKRIIHFSLAVSIAFAVVSQAAQTLRGESEKYFVNLYGGWTQDGANFIQGTLDGGYIILGYSYSFGQPTRKLFLLKTDDAGTPEWERNYETDFESEGFCVKQTSDKGYVAVGFRDFGRETKRKDLLILKTNENGEVQWEKTYGGAFDDIGYSVIETRDGGFLVTGEYSPDESAGGGNFWVMKVDIRGNEVWEKKYGEEIRGGGNSVCATSDGHYVVGGSRTSLLKIKTDGELVWLKKALFGTNGEIESVEEWEGGYIAAGYTYDITGGDVIVIRTDFDGNIIWKKNIGGDEQDIGYQVIGTRDDNFVVVGRSRSQSAPEDEFSEDVYLVKLSGTGDVLWERWVGASHFEIGHSIVQTAEGDFVIVGTFISNFLGSKDLFLMKIDENGSLPKYEINLEFREQERRGVPRSILHEGEWLKVFIFEIVSVPEPKAFGYVQYDELPQSLKKQAKTMGWGRHDQVVLILGQGKGDVRIAKKGEVE